MSITFDQKLSMLIVDDDEVDRMALKRSLTQTHFDLCIDEATDADTALAALEQSTYDCIFLDYNLPGKNGLQLTRTIRRRGIGIPVIVLTGQGNEQTAVELMKAGASDYLPKSRLSSEAIARLIRSAIRMHQAEALVESVNKNLREKNALLERKNRELARQQQYIYKQNLKLQEVSRLKSAFLATMSHELRTPLNAIIGFSQILLSKSKGKQLDDNQQDIFDRILSNGRSLLELIDDILAFSKLEAGRIALRPETLDIAALVRQTVEELRSLASQKSLRLETDIKLNNPIVVNDAARLRQVITNLLSNAIKFTDTGSVSVLLSDRPSGLEAQPDPNLPVIATEPNANTDRIRLSVIDTGCGIAAEDQSYIFDPFHQADQKVTRKHSGTGLGLAITQSIVKIMQGNIVLSSQVGEGSNFTVVLPRIVAAEPENAETRGYDGLRTPETDLLETGLAETNLSEASRPETF